MKKSILITIIAVVALAIIGGGVWFALQQQEEQAPTNQPENGGNATLPDPNEQDPSDQPTPESDGGLSAQFGVVSNLPVAGYVVDSTNTVFLATPDGEVKRVLEGSVSDVATLQHTPVGEVHFSYDGNYLLYAWEADSALRWSVFNVEEKTETTLPSSVVRPTWAPGEHRIAYFDTEGSSHTLSVLEASQPNASATELMDFSAENLLILWARSSQLILSEPPTGYAPGSVWLFDVSSQRLQKLSEGIGSFVNWSPVFNQGLSFVVERASQAYKLSVVDSVGTTTKQVNVATLPGKCEWNNGAEAPIVVCALPQNQNALSSATLPDDYYTGRVSFDDGIFQINLETGELTEVLSSAGASIDVTNLSIVNDVVFFVDKNTNLLHGVNITQQ